MGISRHAVGTGRPIQRVENLRAIHAEFDTRRFQTGEEAVHVSIEKGPLAVIEPHAFPHAVAEQEARIVDRNFRVVAMHDVAVYINLDIPIADIVFCVVGRLTGCVLIAIGAGSRHLDFLSASLKAWAPSPVWGCYR